jgi:hypothetical protein
MNQNSKVIFFNEPAYKPLFSILQQKAANKSLTPHQDGQFNPVEYYQ